MSSSCYRTRFALEDRIQDRRRALQRHPGYVPVIVEATQRGFDRSHLKCLLQRDVTGLQIHHVVRRKFGLLAGDALLLVCGGAIVSQTDTARDLAARYADVEDGFLYIGCARENTFG